MRGPSSQLRASGKAKASRLRHLPSNNSAATAAARTKAVLLGSARMPAVLRRLALSKGPDDIGAGGRQQKTRRIDLVWELHGSWLKLLFPVL